MKEQGPIDECHGVGRMATAIELDAETRGELEQRAASLTLPYRVVVRAKLVLLAAEDHTNREIAERVDMSADRVGDWRRRFRDEGIKGLEDRARSGRPRRFPPEEVAEVKGDRLRAAQNLGRPLSRFSRSELHRFVVERGVSEAFGLDDRALARRGRDPPLAAALLDLPPRPRLPRELGPGARPLRGPLGGQASSSRRHGHQCRRGALDPGAAADPPLGCTGPRQPRPTGRARVRADERPHLPRRLGRAPRRRDRALRTQGRDRAHRSPRPPGDDQGALRLGEARVLGPRQRLRPPRPKVD